MTSFPKNPITVGTKVRFIEDTETINGMDKEVTVKAGSRGTVIKCINADMLYVQTSGRKVLATNWEVETI